MSNLATLLQKIDVLQKEVNTYRPLNQAQEKRLMDKLRLGWNYHSNSIEGNKLTFGETKALIYYGITAKGKPLKDHLEIQGHNEAIEWIVDVVRGNERPLNETFIKELHQLILPKPYYSKLQTQDGQPSQKLIQAGKYKEIPNHVLTKTGEMFYFATPEETPAMMTTLVDWFKAEFEAKKKTSTDRSH